MDSKKELKTHTIFIVNLLVEKFDIELRNLRKNKKKYVDTLEYNQTVRILYHLVDDIYIFLKQTKTGKDLIQKKIQNKVDEIIFVQTDNYFVGYYEQFIYSKLNNEYLKKYDLKLYDTGFLSDNFKDITFGATILSWMEQFLDIQIKLKPTRHFLTLNSRQKLNRIILHDFLQENNLFSKGLCSFHWLYISPDISHEKFVSGKSINLDHDEHLTYVGNSDLHTQDVIPLYEKTLFDIVTPSGHNLVTEKTLRPLLFGKPFLIWMYHTLEDDFEEAYGEYGISATTQCMDKVLFWKKWFDSIDIDINYFDIDYYNPNSIKEKIIELCSMSISEVQEKYKDSFQKAEENKIKINNFIKQRYEQWKV